MFRGRAANEFVTAIEFTDQARWAEAGNRFSRSQTEPSGIFQFHTAV